MANQQETQDFIDEINAPSIYTYGQLVNALQGAAAMVRDGGQQFQKLRGMIQAADMVEDDPVVRGRFEAMIQKLDAMQRQIGVIAQEGRRLNQTRQDLVELVQEFKQVAGDSGYTVS